MNSVAQLAPPRLSIDIIDTVEGLEAFAPAWEEAYSLAPDASSYFCYDWITTMAMGNPLRRFVPQVCVVHDSDGLLAILPISRRYDGPLATPVLKLLAGGWSPRAAPVLAARARQRPLVADLLAELRHRVPFWLSCRVFGVPGDSPLLPSEDEDFQGEFRVERRSIGRSMVIELPADWEIYCKTLSPRFSREIRSHVRAMSRRFKLRLVRAGLDASGDATALGRLIEDALGVSRLSWQGQGRSGTAASHPGVQECFREVCRRLAGRGRLDLSVLYADEKPVSFIWGAARPPDTSIAKSGFDQELRDYSPGTVHMALLLQDSIARGFKEIDLGHEFPEHKRRWAQRGDELFELCWWPAGLPRLAYWSRRGLHACRDSFSVLRAKWSARRGLAVLARRAAPRAAVLPGSMTSRSPGKCGERRN